MLTPPCPGIIQPSIKGRFHHGENFPHTTPEITFNHHQHTQFTNHTYHTTGNSANIYHPTTFRTTNKSCDYQVSHIRRSSWSDSLLNGNFSHEYHNNHLQNTNIISNIPGVPIPDQVRYVVNDASLPTSVMVDQTFYQAAQSSAETFVGNKKLI